MTATALSAHWEAAQIAWMDGVFGGAERDRTAGLLVANEALSQLSYSPTFGIDFSILAACW
uniref:Uncharacterized protein n=1 Tax=mine drainage metagenome TaxID=410659 RepID=E6QN85_9ZZZZ